MSCRTNSLITLSIVFVCSAAHAREIAPEEFNLLSATTNVLAPRVEWVVVDGGSVEWSTSAPGTLTPPAETRVVARDNCVALFTAPMVDEPTLVTVTASVRPWGLSLNSDPDEFTVTFNINVIPGSPDTFEQPRE